MTVRARLHQQDGLVAGAEALAFGVLIFVLGTLLVVNAWAVIDAKFATSSAAREGVRAAVEAPPGSDPMTLAVAAAEAALQGHGIDPASATVLNDGPGLTTLERSQEVAIRVTYQVPAFVLPVIQRSVASFTVNGRHREVVENASLSRRGRQEDRSDQQRRIEDDHAPLHGADCRTVPA